MTCQAPERLLSPAKLGPLLLQNHMVMAPLTRSRAGAGDVPTALMAEYYAQRAEAGLIITEASQISPQGKGYPRTPGNFSAEQIAGWKLVTEAVHARGGRIFLQIWHVGRLSHSSIQPGGGLPVAPSAIAAEGTIITETGLKDLETPREITIDEIPGIVADFRRAAEHAMQAGFDGVEIHAANGYLIDQFLRDGSNKRTDAYGGSPENRARFLKEVVEAVTAAIGASRVGVRLSPVFDGFSMSDSNPTETFSHVADMLSGYGLAYLHGAQLGTAPFDYADFKRRFGGTYIANGGYDAARAEAALREGTADLVAFGSSFLANPDLVERFRRGAPLNQPDPETFYQGEERGYTDYPTLDVA
ncbi:MAG: alkene reductase [Geminicoccaceae bacterium]